MFNPISGAAAPGYNPPSDTSFMDMASATSATKSLALSNLGSMKAPMLPDLGDLAGKAPSLPDLALPMSTRMEAPQIFAQTQPMSYPVRTRDEAWDLAAELIKGYPPLSYAIVMSRDSFDQAEGMNITEYVVDGPYSSNEHVYAGSVVSDYPSSFNFVGSAYITVNEYNNPMIVVAPAGYPPQW